MNPISLKKVNYLPSINNKRAIVLNHKNGITQLNLITSNYKILRNLPILMIHQMSIKAIQLENTKSQMWDKKLGIRHKKLVNFYFVMKKSLLKKILLKENIFLTIFKL